LTEFPTSACILSETGFVGKAWLPRKPVPECRDCIKSGEKKGKVFPGANFFRMKNLISRFGRDSEPARAAIPAFYQAINDNSRLIAAWEKTFSPVYGRGVDRHQVEAWPALYGLCPPIRPSSFLFAVQTYFALWLRLVAGCGLGTKAADTLADSLGSGSGSFSKFGGSGSSSAPSWDFGPDSVGGKISDAVGLFQWIEEYGEDEVGDVVRHVCGLLCEPGWVAVESQPEQFNASLRALYENLFPKKLRHALGEYYTPGWLSEFLLDRVQFQGEAGQRLLDPSCGSGTFLVQAISRVRRKAEQEGLPPEVARECILRDIWGFEINPLAAMAARVNYLMAMGHLGIGVNPSDIPVNLVDPIFDIDPEGQPGEKLPPPGEQTAIRGGTWVGLFDFVVGNPPWINWEDMPPEQTRELKSLWQGHGLLTLSGWQARLGGGKKDLAMLFTVAVAHKYLRRGGRLGLVLPQTAFKTEGAGDGFRRFRLSDGTPLSVTEVHDMVEVRPFQNTGNWTSLLVADKGRETRYPVPYISWHRSPGEHIIPEASLAEVMGRTHRVRMEAQPIDPGKSTSPWVTALPEALKPLVKVVGKSPYQAREGVNPAGAVGVYWLKTLGVDKDGLVMVKNEAAAGKREVLCIQAVLENDLIYPHLRWKDLGRWCHREPGHVLIPHDPGTRNAYSEQALRERWRQTYKYLEYFRAVLEERKSRVLPRTPFYALLGFGPYCMAPFKVSWRSMGDRIRPVVVGSHQDYTGVKPVIPQWTIYYIPVNQRDEADFICAVLGSVVANFVARAYSVKGGKSFGSANLLNYLKIPAFSRSDSVHRELAALSWEAHRLTAGRCPAARVGEVEKEIDLAAGKIWGLTHPELAAMEQSLALLG